MSEDVRYLLFALVMLVVSVFATRVMRRLFTRFRSREQKEGKELIYRQFPKRKKPLGGGMAIFATLIVGVAALPLFKLPISKEALIWLACGVLFAGIGFVDDWRKVNASRGLDDRTKLLMQMVLALFFTVVIVNVRGGNAKEAISVFFPFIGWVPLWQWLFLPFGMLVIVGATNAVNLTDGLDGLAGFGLLISFCGYLFLGAVLHHDGVQPLIPILAIAAVGGFLLHNRPPAKIIMGDTGALGLGAALGALALMSRTEWLLLLLAAPFVIDTLSVVIQVTVIKFFRRVVCLLRHQSTEIFRPFLCTPLHHHFQWLSWGPWPILSLFCGIGVFNTLLGLLAYASNDPVAEQWIWAAGLATQAGFLVFAAMQKAVRANYFLGLEAVEDSDERVLALYKGLPMEVLGARWYNLEEVTTITESMVQSIAAEGILWRNVSEIEVRASLGKIFAEYKMFDKAAEEWEEIPPRNLLIRESLVVQLGKIYFGRDELLRAVKLWEQLPPSRLARIPGLVETIQGAKVRVGHLAGRLYHQARDHAAALAARRQAAPEEIPDTVELIAELEAALRYTQDLRELLAHDQRKAEADGEDGAPEAGGDLYRRMDAMLAARREELREALQWTRELGAPAEGSQQPTALERLAQTLRMTPAEIGRALELKAALPVADFLRVDKPSRNALYAVEMQAAHTAHLPERLIAKCYEESQITFFSACYRRERGVMQILNDVDAPAPRIFGGHLGARMAVLFMEDVGARDLSAALQALDSKDRAAKMSLVRLGLDTLLELQRKAMPVLPRLEREIAKIVKEVLTPEYYFNASVIAINRILSLERRSLSRAEQGKLEVALRPLVDILREEPKTFIHFEYTPGNLLYDERRVTAVDFEQATMGPAAFDLATLLFTPEVDPSEDEVEFMLRLYHEHLPDEGKSALAISPDALLAAAIFKMFVYAGAAANFYQKFEESRRLSAMEWHLLAAESLMARNPAYHDLAAVLRQCWSGQRTLGV